MTPHVGRAVAATVIPLSLLVAGVLGTSLAAWAQPAGKVYRIGVLTAHPPAWAASERPWATQWAAFLKGLQAHGWVENRNFVFESRYSEGRAEHLAQLAR